MARSVLTTERRDPSELSIGTAQAVRPSGLGPLTVLMVLLSWLMAGAARGELVEGFTEPYRQIDIAVASETGLITELPVREGQHVKAGQLLVMLDTDVLVATLDIARERSQVTGRIDGAKAELQLRQRRLEKLQQLVREGHATAGELDRAEADVAIAQSNVLLADEERRLAALECKRIEVQIERRQVKSPIDGVVTQVLREVGEAVAINEPELLTVVQLNPLRVKFSLAARAAMDIQEGQTLSLQLSDAGIAATGRVEVVSPVLDAKSGTVQVTCRIENPDNKYRSGMRCVLRVPDSTPPGPRTMSAAPSRPTR